MATQPSTDVATIEPPKVPVQSGGKVAAFVPTTMEEAWRLSGALAKSQMTPKSYANDQNKIMVGIMAGAEVGLTPFAALQSIAVIGNNPSLWGDGALALIQASGLLEDMEETDDGTTATCRLNRAGRSTPIIKTFSMEDAKKAGLAGKAGPWTQYPARMRQMRARAFAMRDGFADVLKGLHIAEEVRDYSGIAGEEALPSQPALTAGMLTDQAQPAEVEEVEAEEVVAGHPVDRDNLEAVEAERTEDDPFGLPPLDSKPPEPAADKSPTELFLDDIRERIGVAATKEAVKAIDDDWLLHRAAYDDATVEEIDGLIAEKRAGMGEG